MAPQQGEHSVSKWACNATEALTLRLVGVPSNANASADGKDAVAEFSPEFTYQIGFGQEETIYGYSGLRISLSFAAQSLYPLLTLDFSEVNESTSAKIDDVPAILAEYLPAGDYTTDPEDFARRLQQDSAEDFVPLSEKVAEYSRPVAASGSSSGKGKGKRTAPGSSAAGSSSSSSSASTSAQSDDAHFEIYRSTWSTPGWREFHRRMQIFALLYIEGASYIHEDEQNWEWLTVWQKWQDKAGRQRYTFVGYTSLYRFWHYPSSSRLRLSQIMILPPYHKQSHGTRLYAQVYAQVLADEAVTELTVEDPNEAFDRLRDTADLKMLLQPGGIIEEMKKEKLGQDSDAEAVPGIRAPLDRQRSEQWRHRAKLAKRQWNRLLEMIQLMELDPADEVAIKAFRLQVKARLYRFNKDVLVQMDVSERRVKLQETYENLLDGEYGDLVGVDVEPFLDGPEGAEGGAANGGSFGGFGSMFGFGGAGPSAAKKPRV